MNIQDYRWKNLCLLGIVGKPWLAYLVLGFSEFKKFIGWKTILMYWDWNRFIKLHKSYWFREKIKINKISNLVGLSFDLYKRNLYIPIFRLTEYYLLFLATHCGFKGKRQKRKRMERLKNWVKLVRWSRLDHRQTQFKIDFVRSKKQNCSSLQVKKKGAKGLVPSLPIQHREMLRVFLVFYCFERENTQALNCKSN